MASPYPPARGTRLRHVVFDPGGTGGRRIVDFSRAARRGFDQIGSSPFELSPTDRPWPTERDHRLRDDEESFVLWLFAQAGMDGSAYRAETLRRRMGACLRALRARSISHACEILEGDPSRIQLAVGALVIGVTSFFRDAAVFDHLTYSALAMLPRPPAPRRIWSAGCSDGEELYSVAILLAEMNLLKGATLLGTDCRAGAISAARRGRYGPAAVKDVPEPWREKYFACEGAAWCVSAALRDAPQWRRGDVTQVQEPGGWDVILCRNMAMYLRPEVAGRLWQQLEDALRPGGFLVLGKAERPVGARQLSPVGPCIYRRG